MRVNFLANVDFYSPIANFIEKQSKLRLLIGVVVIGIFSGLALYHVVARFWSNRVVQPKELEKDSAVKQVANEIVGEVPQKQGPVIQEKPLERLKKEEPLLVADVPPVIVKQAENGIVGEVLEKQDPVIQEKIVTLPRGAKAFIERNCIIFDKGTKNFFLEEDVFKHFPGKVYMQVDSGMGCIDVHYRNEQSQTIDYIFLNPDDPKEPEAYTKIKEDPTYEQILVVVMADVENDMFYRADESSGKFIKPMIIKNSKKILPEPGVDVYLDRNCIVLTGGVIDHKILDHFPGNVYLKINTGNGCFGVLYRDAQTLLTNFIKVIPDDSSEKDYKKIVKDPTYKEILVTLGLSANNNMFREAGEDIDIDQIKRVMGY